MKFQRLRMPMIRIADGSARVDFVVRFCGP